MLKIEPVNLICTIINLLVLFVALRVFLFKPVQKIIAARQEEADKQLNEAAARQAEAEAMKEQYESSLEDAEKERRQILQTARQDADEQSAKIVDDAKRKAKQIEEQALAEAESKKSQILINTEKEIADMVVSAAGKIVGSKSGEELDSSLYDEFLVKAGEKQ